MGFFRGPERVTALTKASSTQVTLAAGFQLSIGGQQYSSSQSRTLSIGTVGVGGLDATAVVNRIYYVYAVVSGGTVALIASLNSSGPLGFTGYRFLGGFNITNAGTVGGILMDQNGKINPITIQYARSPSFNWAVTVALVDYEALIKDDFGLVTTGANWRMIAPFKMQAECSMKLTAADSGTGFAAAFSGFLFKNGGGYREDLLYFPSGSAYPSARIASSVALDIGETASFCTVQSSGPLRVSFASRVDLNYCSMLLTQA